MGENPFVSQRVKKLPEYLFMELDRKKEEVLKKGVDVIDLGVGDPDLPTPDPIVEELRERVKDPSNHVYPSYSGMRAFREEVSRWFEGRFGVSIDPDREVVTLIGSKEGIFHLPMAVMDPGDGAIVPDPGYPVYRSSVILSGGFPYPVPLLKENGFLPDLDSIPSSVYSRVRLFFINYPNNPTASTADLSFFEKIVFYAKKYGFVVAHDAAYSEIYFGDRAPCSILEVEGAKDCAIEFHSLSKTFSMTGWRIGFAVGSKAVVSALSAVKSNADSGVFNAIQWAGVRALREGKGLFSSYIEVYKRRRGMMADALERSGYEISGGEATFYLWVRTPSGTSSMEFTSRLLEEKGVLVTPGVGFGEFGEGYFRISLTVPDERLEEAARRISSSDG